MALTFTPVEKWTAGDRLIAVVLVTFDNSYATGGKSVVVKDLGFRNRISHIHPLILRNSSGDICWARWTGSALQAFRVDQVDDFGEEVPNGTDLSGFSGRIVAYGK